ncbi:MAG: group III truncated hemoglobin [Mesorhizobium sp.]|uniref:group III truncated hemoglobin n=1 Tax=Mesorhizobium sp. TaxID=1871066 RepID=UPI000FE49119|nr:group III truncated hemoglobin [Mesorhizobium sp.]RWB79011.1 MAG: group III truncated hemoglobin [Mesorhizobium sp.]RWL84386.1 MAG: group III truncated hemoglobin [Mesorhizobium sp.]RWL88135.1 MAG: group III truncated hemoglobin [Mesorhizobium sp.]RWM03259.1 MAG: group III truncated hemoglobin [Mesorhizobium sp.]RWM04765.1 MAG: group III truncated hemoglobin [Mesorhizobium sp.]
MTSKPALLDRVRPVAEQPLARPGVDRASIGVLVREFYSRVRKDGRLGPIFAREIVGDWEPHLEKMTDFWCSVILKSGDYHGRPVPAHLKLKDVTEADFGIWLALFGETASRLFAPEIAAVFVERAERIATSLKLAMFFHLGHAARDVSGKV